LAELRHAALPVLDIPDAIDSFRAVTQVAIDGWPIIRPEHQFSKSFRSKVTLKELGNKAHNLSGNEFQSNKPNHEQLERVTIKRRENAIFCAHSRPDNRGKCEAGQCDIRSIARQRAIGVIDSRTGIGSAKADSSPCTAYCTPVSRTCDL
jgi:hypothetical protein